MNPPAQSRSSVSSLRNRKKDSEQRNRTFIIPPWVRPLTTVCFPKQARCKYPSGQEAGMVQELILAAKEHSLHLNQQAPSEHSKGEEKKGRRRKRKKEQASAFSSSTIFQPGLSEIRNTYRTQPCRYRPQNARSRTAPARKHFFGWSPALATGLGTWIWGCCLAWHMPLLFLEPLLKS